MSQRAALLGWGRAGNVRVEFGLIGTAVVPKKQTEQFLL